MLTVKIEKYSYANDILLQDINMNFIKNNLYCMDGQNGV